MFETNAKCLEPRRASRLPSIDDDNRFGNLKIPTFVTITTSRSRRLDLRVTGLTRCCDVSTSRLIVPILPMTCSIPRRVPTPTGVRPCSVDPDYVLAHEHPRKNLSRPLGLLSTPATIVSVTLRSDVSGRLRFTEMGATTPHIRYIT